MNINTLTPKKAAKLIEAAQQDIEDLRAKVNATTGTMNRNNIRMQIESRQSIIKTLNTKFFNQ